MSDPTSPASLASMIARRRESLDQRFYTDIRKLRRQHGDAAVDRALAQLQEQRDRVSAAPKDRGPQHFRKLGLAR
jgi:hypothetical protein